MNYGRYQAFFSEITFWSFFMRASFDAKEFDRCRFFKLRHLGCPGLTLTGATVADDGERITVTDAAGFSGSMAYDSEVKRDGILKEIDRARRAERLQQEHIASTPGYHEKYGTAER